MKKDTFTGCLLGGALGDSLGYEIEFRKWNDIKHDFGPNGIQDLNEKRRHSIAAISDDTQMTLFTCEGLIAGKENLQKSENNSSVKYGSKFESTYDSLSMKYILSIWNAYRDWFATQDYTIDYRKWKTDSWLFTIPAMFQRQAPGITCLNALHNKDFDLDELINNSKGCGGVMRTAPIGLFFDPEKMYTELETDKKDRDVVIEEIVQLGSNAAMLTHRHPLGYITSGAFVHLINQIVYPEFYDRNSEKKKLSEMIEQTVVAIEDIYCEIGYTRTLARLLRRAVELAQMDVEDHAALKELGEGWIAEEALAVAVYCAVKYCDDFRKAIQAAVNHDGDSDSTGSICGNILGAYLGMEKIKDAFDLEQLELKDVILEMSEKLYNAAQI